MILKINLKSHVHLAEGRNSETDLNLTRWGQYSATYAGVLYSYLNIANMATNFAGQ